MTLRVFYGNFKNKKNSSLRNIVLEYSMFQIQ